MVINLYVSENLYLASEQKYRSFMLTDLTVVALLAENVDIVRSPTCNLSC